MIVNQLKLTVEKNKNTANPLFLKTLLKNRLQDYILNFVYNQPVYKNLIFTGGTCLRKVYGLPRLSEDLDFDYLKDFDIKDFSQKLKSYFVKNLQFKEVSTKISGNKKTVFIKFPILSQLGLAKTKAESSILFVRCDFSKEETGIFNTEINSISTEEFSFFVLSYDWSTLFANKIVAFLERQFFKGKEQKTSFKGRDVFDIVWFLEKSKKTNWSLKPNWGRVFKRLKTKDSKEVIKKIFEKMEKIDKQSVYKDLLPFIEDSETLENFKNYFSEIIKRDISFVS